MKSSRNTKRVVRGPKVKTGCITCKIRHVKCDEAKPKCERCTKGDYICDGYPAQSSNKAPEDQTPLKPKISPSLVANDPLGPSDQFDIVRQYMRDFYTFGAVGSTIRPAAFEHPILYNALVWHCQCELEALKESSPSPVAFAIKGKLLRQLRQQLSSGILVPSCPPEIVLVTMTLLTCGVSISCRGEGSEYGTHVSGLQALTKYYMDQSLLADSELRTFTARIVCIYWFSTRMVNGNRSKGADSNSLWEYLRSLNIDKHIKLGDQNSSCENPWSSKTKEFSQLKSIFRPETLKLFHDIRQLTDIVISLGPSDLTNGALKNALELQDRLLRYGSLFSKMTTDPYQKSCYITTLILLEMANLGVTHRSPETALYQASLRPMIGDLFETIKKTNYRYLWEDRKGVLFWINCIVVPLSRGLPEHPFFRALLVRSAIYFVSTESFAKDILNTLQTTLSFQQACERGYWKEVFKPLDYMPLV